MENIKSILQELNKVVHEKTRLGILILLYKRGELNFKYLKHMLGVSDGSLATHLKTLAREGYIIIRKKFVRGKPRTEYKLTNEGKLQLEKYIEKLEELIKVFKTAV